jgi:hypothetical protein
MDTIAVIIITAFINIIISSIVSNFMFYRYKKRIETSFAESLFEHQTKFERHHQKTSETLESLYQIIIVISDKYEKTVYGCTNFYKNNLEFIHFMDMQYLNLEMKDIEYLKSKSDEFSSCFNSNRLYLSPSSIRAIKSIHHRVDGLIQVVPHYVKLLFDFDDTSPEFMYRLNESIEKLDLGSHRIVDIWGFMLLFSDFVEEMNRQAEKLEFLYKSIADINEETSK